MSILRRTLQLGTCAALAVTCAFAQAPTNLYLLPNSSAVSPLTTSFRTDPFSVFSSFPVQPGASFLLMHPNGQKLYSVARSGADTLWVLDAANPGTVLRRQSLGQAEAAAISPDGRRVLVAAGSLHIIDTTSDTVIAALSDVGNTPTDVAVALDGSRAFVLSPASNRLTAVDLSTNLVAGPAITVPGLSTGVAVGPNGLVYVSTVNLVQVIDGRTMTIIKEIQLNASPGKLVFTPDGQYALTVNKTPVTGSSVIMFDLIGNKVQGSIPNFQVTLDRLVFGAGNRVYGISNQTATLYEITTNPLNINPPQFSGIGQLSNVTDIAVSGEVPNSRFMFIATPGSMYRLDLGSNPANASGQVAIPTQPGPLVHLNAQTTGTPTQVLGYNTAQTTTPGGTYLPLIVRVTNSVGRPLYAVSVTFTSDNPNAQIQGATVTTNAQGWAQTTVVAPQTAGTFTVTAAAGPGPSQPTANFILTASAGSTGGGATSLLSIASGQGQMVSEQFLLTEPFTVRVRDNNGNPVVGQVVTFALASGSGTLATSTFAGATLPNTTCSGNVCTATTDSEGLASASFLATAIPPGFSFTQQTISASTGQATVNFIVTTLLSQLPGGGQAAQPLAERLKPIDTNVIVAQAGTTVNEAIQIRLVASSGIQAGQPIPNVALRVRTPNTDPAAGPTALCSGEGDVALTDSSGIATCNLKVGGKLGFAQLQANIGGTLGLGGGSINLDVRPGPPSILRILQGNNQSGNPGQRLTLAFLIQVEDGFGNALPGIPVQWEVVTPNSITLGNVVSVADNSGRVSALGTLGTVAGTNQVRVRAGSVVQTFNFTTNITISQLNKLSGDGQSALMNQPFALPLVAEVRDERNNPVPGQAVQWSVVNGSATLSSSTASTGSNGQSSVNVTAGSTAGSVTIRAALGNLTQSYTLTVRPPGPVFNAAGIVTTARNQPGVSPCGLATIYGSNIAIGVTGTINTNFLGIGGLPLSYNDVSVAFGGMTAPILAISNQAGTESMVVQVPCELAPGRTSVVIRIPGAQSQVDNIEVFRAAPGLFETPATGGQRSYAAIVRPDGSYVTPANPARRGEILQVAVTGLGQTTPPAVTNRIGSGNQQVAAGLVVGVNDQGVRVVSATYAPGMIGVYWVAFELPADTTPGVFRNFAVAAENASGALVFGNSSSIAAIQ